MECIVKRIYISKLIQLWNLVLLILNLIFLSCKNHAATYIFCCTYFDFCQGCKHSFQILHLLITECLKKLRFFLHKEAVIIVWLAFSVRLLLSSSWLAYTLVDATPVGSSQRLYNGLRGMSRRWWRELIEKTALWKNAVKSRLNIRDCQF